MAPVTPITEIFLEGDDHLQKSSERQLLPLHTSVLFAVVFGDAS